MGRVCSRGLASSPGLSQTDAAYSWQQVWFVLTYGNSEVLLARTWNPSYSVAHLQNVSQTLSVSHCGPSLRAIVTPLLCAYVSDRGVTRTISGSPNGELLMAVMTPLEACQRQARDRGIQR